MGTTVRCKSYLPGYHPMRVLNEKASGSRSQCYEDNMLSGHLYNGFMLRPVNEYSECDKEMLKQKMLEHEVIFRKQVYELHRLYRIQRDLMDECQKKGSYNYSIPSDTSQSNSISSQMPCEGTKKIWHLSHLPVVNTSFERAPFARTDDMRSSLNFLKESSVQSGPVSIQNGVSLKDGELLDSKVQKFPRRMFDLELPADVYIDSEDSKRSGKTIFADSSSRDTVPPNGTCSDDPENDVKLTLHTGDDPNCKMDNKVPESQTQNGLSAHRLVNLDKAVIKDICFQGTADAASTHFLGLRTHSEENESHQLTSRSNTNSLGPQSVFSKRRHGDKASSSNYLCADKEERRWEWPFSYRENVNTGQSGSSSSFFSQNLSNDKFPISSEPVQLKLKNAHGIVLPHRNKTETWIRQKPNYGIETSGTSADLAPSNDSAMTAPSMPATFSVLSQTDSFSTAPSLVSSWTKPVNSMSHIPTPVQAVPCFNSLTTLGTQNLISHAAIQNIGADCENWQTSRDSRTCPRAGSEAPSYLNGSLDGFQLDSKHAPYSQLQSITFGEPNCNNRGNSSSQGNAIGHGPQKCFKGLQCTDVKSTRDVNLNQALPNGIQNNLAAQQHMVIHGLEQKFEESLQGISWLRNQPACNESIDSKKHATQMELVFTHGHSQLMSSSNVVAPESERKQDKESGLCNPQCFTSILQEREIGLRRNEISDNLSSRRILGFPIIDKVQQDAASHQECSLTNGSKCIDKDICRTDLTCGMKEHSSEKPISIGSLITEKGDENISTSIRRNCINLNAELTCMDDPSLLEFSPKSEVAVPLPLPVPRASAEVDSEINVEAPPISQAEGNILSHQEYMSSSKMDGSQETECSHDELVREAAENIVAMSVDAHSHLEETACHPLPPTQWDDLFWFADVVSSHADNAGVRRSGGDGTSESSEDGLDFFEAMTLKLEEIKVDECCSKPNEFENKQEGATGAASLLLMRPRRGQARRRRQRRDFQKDILPGLASLSRHEVTEDLQAIGGLMKASGKSWKTSSTRRNAGRNGLHCQAKGRRQSRNLAVALSETQDSSPPVDPINDDLQVDEGNMIGWGKTTRRCRRPRCPPGNVPAPVTVPYPW